MQRQRRADHHQKLFWRYDEFPEWAPCNEDGIKVDYVKVADDIAVKTVYTVVVVVLQHSICHKD